MKNLPGTIEFKHHDTNPVLKQPDYPTKKNPGIRIKLRSKFVPNSSAHDVMPLKPKLPLSIQKPVIPIIIIS